MMISSFSLTWGSKTINVGKNERVLINQLVGSNSVDDYQQGIKKIDMWDNEKGPDIITDVSLLVDKNIEQLWKYALKKENYIVGTVPIYNFFRDERIDEEAFVQEIKHQLQSGVKLLTLHLTPSKELIELSKRRIVPFTSRGGGIVISDLLRNKRSQNVILQCLDEIINLCKDYDAAISIGTSFRPANVIDSFDDAQIREIEIQMEYANYISNQGVKVIIEMPGHMSPRKISALNSLIKDNIYPIMPLGPVVTDVGVGMDHITSAIGLTLMGLENNVQIISAMTSEEHVGGIPSIASTKEAVKTARLVAHIIDMENREDYSEDEKIARLRQKSCVLSDGKACDRCGLACPLRRNILEE